MGYSASPLDFRFIFAYPVFLSTKESDAMHLTKRQREIFEYLKEHIRSRGYAPSIVEIGKRFQLRSPATVHKHLAHLEEKGLIRKQHNLSRAIEVVEKPSASRLRCWTTGKQWPCCPMRKTRISLYFGSKVIL